MFFNIVTMGSVEFGEFKKHMENSRNLKERLHSIVNDLESVTRVMQANLLQVHYSSLSPDILKTKGHIGRLKEHYG